MDKTTVGSSLLVAVRARTTFPMGGMSFVEVEQPPFSVALFCCAASISIRHQTARSEGIDCRSTHHLGKKHESFWAFVRLRGGHLAISPCCVDRDRAFFRKNTSGGLKGGFNSHEPASRHPVVGNSEGCVGQIQCSLLSLRISFVRSFCRAGRTNLPTDSP